MVTHQLDELALEWLQRLRSWRIAQILGRPQSVTGADRIKERSYTPPVTGDSSRAPKAVLHRYLRRHRDNLVAKLDGLGEREVRWPMTPTGTNLLGLVKHCAGVQLAYFGEVFDRPIERELPWMAEDAELNADMWATANETRAEILDLFRFSCSHADETIEALEAGSPGRVPWWPPERQAVNLHLVLVHVAVEVARHAGHADIIRELIDGAAGNNDGNLPELTSEQWSAYCSSLKEAAEEAAARTPGARS